MDAQELRNLQEAYMEVVMNELDEEQKPLPTARMANQRRGAWEKAKEATETGNESERKKQIGRYNAMSFPETRRAHLKSKTPRESYDIYDIILSHLLDEGYAETPEAAEAIMVNMSEEWREGILDEAQIMSVSGKGGLKYMINPKIVRAQNAAARERQGRQERENQAKDAANVERSAQARKASIQRLNAKPGADSGDYDSGYHGDDDTSGGKRHYSLSRTDRNARKRRANGR